MDNEDPLRKFKERFHIPEVNGQPAIYFCGNSLGLQPKTAAAFLESEMRSWAEKGVEGHFMGENPWLYARKRSKPLLAGLLGAKELETVAMNSLSTNLHLLLVSFYQPKGKKTKILTEPGAFPSDRYILESQSRFHGLQPKDTIIQVQPRKGEHILRTEDVLRSLRLHADELALVMMSGVQYYTGQWFDMRAITEAAAEKGIPVGFDLAHAIGNVPLQLHDWGVDFATWCSYKYLNSGPGNISGIFVHERHAHRSDLPRFAGWWGHNEETRFLMDKDFEAMPGADGWLLSNDHVLGLAVHQASLEIFEEAGLENLRKKSELLTGYLEFLIRKISGDGGILEIITPSLPKERGCQISLLIHKGGKAVFDALYRQGIIGDWRNPNVIRLAPVPLYNSFTDIYKFAGILEISLREFV
ncbi:kynureninase [Negadavirga shengliensis]|uniref:Kynureninase n=1 Tax=Negadavirga shengliensis TaxID=1389218 RepID=A0ABV9SVN7_9BACT